ncbi:MAG: pyridoxal 5'-phosphate synthase glutaminase subunit PdxT, partial [Actinomycetota bacterium]
RQVQSFEADVDVAGIGEMRAVFIRAPRVERVGDEVETLADHDGDPVVVRQGHVLLASFHPELTGDDRLHRLFVSFV